MMKTRFNLPEPPPQAQARSLQLKERLLRTIAREGPMPFSRYMEKVLYTPGLGYYSSGLPKLGETGDFTTAPEISPLFGQCVARQVDQILSRLPAGGHVLEFGAGSGKLARDMLLTLAETGTLPQRYQIVELSADLQARQRQLLQESLPQELFGRVEWCSRLPEAPWEGVVIANEVLDAMPVEVFQLWPDTAWRMGVDAEDGELVWRELPITEPHLQRIANALMEQVQPASPGYRAEVNLNLRPWLSSLADFLTRGAVLLIDYGFSREELYQKERLNGSLRCFYQHRVHDNPFFWPGLQDITAHVDFTAVAEAGFEAGFRITGFTTQAHFLMSTGLLEQVPTDLPVTEQLKLAQQIKTLTLPDEMGEVFKVMALTRDLEGALMGFQLVDLRDTL